jgi:endonuclease III
LNQTGIEEMPGKIFRVKSQNPGKSSRKNLVRKTQAKQILQLIRSAVHSTTALGSIRATSNSDPFRILVSTILSQRTRDSVTEKVSNQLFKKYSDASSFATADPIALASDIRSVSFYNQKTLNIIEACKLLLSKHEGKVPRTYSELLDLPGVGRKTAGCVLVYGFGDPAIPVDTHVHRISNRIGLVRTKTADETEEALEKLYDKKYWIDINELFVSFGQTVCLPVRPRCPTCPVRTKCAYYKENVRKINRN